jgi:ABC-2 type transport system permease protein
MGTVGVIFRRELGAYFTTPVAYVFIVIFLVMAGTLTFYVGNFFERGQADLEPFFNFHPWLYLFLIPALSMRLWAEERKSGTVELLLTLPITTPEAVLGKFLGAWVFTGIALALTVPLWVTVNFLGSPDNGVILAGYVGSFLMAGAFLAIGAACSALTKSQVIAFVISASMCFLFIAMGSRIVQGPIQGLLPAGLVQAITALSFPDHFASITRGQVAVSDVFFFVSVMALFLFANTVLVELKKAD